MLLRDQPAIADLVQSVLGQLVHARGGAEPLLATLDAYFATGGVTTETARRLHLSVRAVTYRLDRIKTAHRIRPHRPRTAVHHPRRRARREAAGLAAAQPDYNLTVDR